MNYIFNLEMTTLLPLPLPCSHLPKFHAGAIHSVKVFQLHDYGGHYWVAMLLLNLKWWVLMQCAVSFQVLFADTFEIFMRYHIVSSKLRTMNFELSDNNRTDISDETLKTTHSHFECPT